MSELTSLKNSRSEDETASKLEDSQITDRHNEKDSFSELHLHEKNEHIREITHNSIRDTWVRWLALALASFLVFGNDYCYDIPQAMEVPLQENFNISEVEYNLLYSVYSLPNVILPFLGGWILDYFGIATGILLYNSLIIFGQILFMLGSHINSFNMLVLSRGVFGIGAESLNVAQSAIVTMWFKGKEMSTALGVSLCICRLGSSLNSYLSPMLYEQYKSITSVGLAGLVWTLMSFCCGLVLIKMDKKYFKDEKEEGTESVNCKDIKKLNPSFWMLYINGILCYMSFFSFLNIANKYLQVKFSFSSTRAGSLLAIPYAVAGILTPILSNYIDRKGKKASLMIFSCGLLCFVHFFMAFTPECNQCNRSLVSLFVYGTFFAFYTSLLISSVSVISDHRVIGTALGIVYSGQNTGLAIGPMVVGAILNDQSDLKNEYEVMSLVLAGLAFLAMMDAVLNYFYDKYKNGGVLQKNMEELALRDQNVTLQLETLKGSH